MATESKGTYGTMAQRRAKTKLKPKPEPKPKPKPVMPDNLRKLEAAFMRDIRLGMAWEDHFDQPTLAITRLGDEGP